MYLDEIPKDQTSASAWNGKRLDPTVFEKVRNCHPVTILIDPKVICLPLEDVGRTDRPTLRVDARDEEYMENRSRTHTIRVQV